MYITNTNIYIYIYICIHTRNNLTSNKGNDGEKVNLFYLKFKIFQWIIYNINKYLKLLFTLNTFQDIFSCVKFKFYNKYTLI